MKDKSKGSSAPGSPSQDASTGQGGYASGKPKGEGKPSSTGGNY